MRVGGRQRGRAAIRSTKSHTIVHLEEDVRRDRHGPEAEGPAPVPTRRLASPRRTQEAQHVTVQCQLPRGEAGQAQPLAPRVHGFPHRQIGKACRPALSHTVGKSRRRRRRRAPRGPLPADEGVKGAAPRDGAALLLLPLGQVEVRAKRLRGQQPRPLQRRQPRPPPRLPPRVPEQQPRDSGVERRERRRRRPRGLRSILLRRRGRGGGSGAQQGQGARPRRVGVRGEQPRQLRGPVGDGHVLQGRDPLPRLESGVEGGLWGQESEDGPAVGVGGGEEPRGGVGEEEEGDEGAEGGVGGDAGDEDAEAGPGVDGLDGVGDEDVGPRDDEGEVDAGV